MSSIYRAICMNHDPALELDKKEWHSSDDGRGAIYAAIKSKSIEDHMGCDLLMGRYSYPLLEVGCPGNPPSCTHNGPIWIDTDWLRLLWQAIDSKLMIPKNLLRCWTSERLERLKLHMRGSS